jgi:hypothetical protein
VLNFPNGKRVGFEKKVLQGGWRMPYRSDMGVTAVADALLINVGGGPMALLRPQAALDLVTAVGDE